MEFNFSASRLILLASLIAAFWWFGGFSIGVPHDAFHDPGRVTKAWLYCVILFFTGAGSASVIDHYVGTLDRWNMRVAYVLLGVALMVGSSLWMAALKRSLSLASE